MSAPVLHVLAGPNGSGKSTFAHHVLQPITHLPFINADEIAEARWPGQAEHHAYEAAAAAAHAREETISLGRSFIAETVFSHPSKIGLIERAIGAGYIVELHVLLVPEELAVARVAYRVGLGGHTVPEEKIRGRYRRLWPLIARARQLAHQTTFYDNTSSKPFRPVATYMRDQLVGTTAWPEWTPPDLLPPGH